MIDLQRCLLLVSVLVAIGCARQVTAQNEFSRQVAMGTLGGRPMMLAQGTDVLSTDPAIREAADTDTEADKLVGVEPENEEAKKNESDNSGPDAAVGSTSSEATESQSGGFWGWITEALVWTRDTIRDVLMPLGVVALAVGLILFCFAAWLLNLVALPGNWLAIAMMAFYVWLGPEEGRWRLGLFSLVVAFALGLVGELIEFLAGAMGASRAGASRRATLMAIIGSIAGAILGGIVGLPIPVVGPVLAAILFGGLGATAGAMFAEWNNGKPWKENWRIGQAAFWGRTAGTVGKMLAGLAVLVVCVVGVLF
ncbi:DUF456 domain-containing protein [Rhodopirellula sp. JC740]|uniref:DUF456 domain-containing protein n=1 Tax=Rhodopirellula halodulae TaxID=2894198 RepID=A0ABS8NMD3_9BACT|nr:DUF456 domain-containing protein [Rhodopirellula sp. JC740]MCC9644670.1 DUF456 domain-containing protein [Rhodopirellula sp. JC740]